MVKPRVGYDIDGVGFNFGDSCRRYLDHIGKGHLWKSGPTPEPYWNWYRDWGWSDQDFVEFCHEGADAGFIFAGPVKIGYRESIDLAASLGCEIVIVTDRSFGTTPEVSETLTVEWLNQHGIYHDKLIFSPDKTVGNCDFFIDDKIANHDALVAAGTKSYLLNRPWNQVEGGDVRNRIDSIHEYSIAIWDAVLNKGYDLTLA